MLLTDIPKYINCKKIYNLKKKKINYTNIYSNSNSVDKASIFIIDVNKKIKNEYIEEGLKKGVVALLTNKYRKNFSITQFVVDNLNKNAKILLNILFPYKPINSIGITGTNGKTSVAWFISQICKLNNIPIKSHGTLGFYKNCKKIRNSNLTTSEYEVLYQDAFLKKNNNLYNFVFEVSSHALAQNRIKDFPINIAAITNITYDHLDYHKTYKNYKNIKIKLFTHKLAKDGIAIINDNISATKKLKKTLHKTNKIITYGTKNSDINIFSNKNKIKIYKKNFKINLFDYSSIELENITCAICCCLCININIEKILNVLPKMKKPEGRLEKIGKLKNNSQIFVDYAHTPDALKNVLINKTILKTKPSVVFGCGGGRDKGKRFLMGDIANRYANKVYITDDNPRYENPQKIRKAILSKCAKAVEIPDRKKAIEEAIYNLNKNEILIIAGKGHEKKQIFKNQINNFEDAKICKSIIQKIK